MARGFRLEFEQFKIMMMIAPNSIVRQKKVAHGDHHHQYQQFEIKKIIFNRHASRHDGRSIKSTLNPLLP